MVYAALVTDTMRDDLYIENRVDEILYGCNDAPAHCAECNQNTGCWHGYIKRKGMFQWEEMETVCVGDMHWS